MLVVYFSKSSVKSSDLTCEMNLLVIASANIKEIAKEDKENHVQTLKVLFQTFIIYLAPHQNFPDTFGGCLDACQPAAMRSVTSRC